MSSFVQHTLWKGFLVLCRLVFSYSTADLRLLRTHFLALRAFDVSKLAFCIVVVKYKLDRNVERGGGKLARAKSLLNRRIQWGKFSTQGAGRSFQEKGFGSGSPNFFPIKKVSLLFSNLALSPPLWATTVERWQKPQDPLRWVFGDAMRITLSVRRGVEHEWLLGRVLVNYAFRNRSIKFLLEKPQGSQALWMSCKSECDRFFVRIFS